MRIAFIIIGNSRRSNYLNGDTIRYGGGGGSGTDGTNIIVAEQLARLGHEVVVATEKLEPLLESKLAKEGKAFCPDKVIRGVRYCDLDFNGVENKTFDILHTCLWFKDYDKLPVKVTKALIYHSHMQWIYSADEMINFVKNNNLAFGVVHISKWERDMNAGTIHYMTERFPNIKTTLIPNPIMDDMVNEVLATNPIRKPHKFVFHAAWPRGGNVAVQAVRELNFPDTEFHAFDYLMCTHDHKDSFFHRYEGVDKKTLFTHIAESEYFVYPLYTPYQDVHKDTFSCVVAEAIALGAIPITYPLGALPEYFDGHCMWLDFPKDADPIKMQSEALSKDLKGIFTCTDNIVRKVKYLEEKESLFTKAMLRTTGTDFILNAFNSQKVGGMWNDFIKILVGQILPTFPIKI